MAKPKAVEFLAPDRRMLDLKRRAAMPGGFAETEVPRTVERMIGDLESRFAPLLQRKQQRMAEILGDTTDTATARARAEELRRLAKDVLSMAPLFGYHAVGDMAAMLADTIDRLDFADPQVQSFCRWQVDADPRSALRFLSTTHATVHLAAPCPSPGSGYRNGSPPTAEWCRC